MLQGVPVEAITVVYHPSTSLASWYCIDWDLKSLFPAYSWVYTTTFLQLSLSLHQVEL